MNFRKLAWMAVAVAVAGLWSASADAGLLSPCCPKPCCQPCCAPPPPVEVCVMVCHPCTGCPVPVKLCVPCCCAAEKPCVSTRGALIGQGVSTVSYCCGFEAKIRWDRCGNPTVVRTRG